MEREIPKNYFPVIDVDRTLESITANAVAAEPFTEAGSIWDGVMVVAEEQRRVCSNTLFAYTKEQEAKKRQQMKKRGKRK